MDLTNEELLEKYSVVVAQQAIAAHDHQPRKEKQYEREMLKLEKLILERMGR